MTNNVYIDAGRSCVVAMFLIKCCVTKQIHKNVSYTHTNLSNTINYNYY